MKSQYVLPVTIVVAGALIAGAVFLAGKTGGPGTGETDKNVTARAYTQGVDHILGNPNAAIKVVTYEDLECPFCKQFHTTMHQIMEYYGPSGNVAWVFRHFPLTQIHSKAPVEAQAAECAADQGGDTAYYKYLDRIYEITPGSNGLDLAKLPEVARELGLNADTFNQCLKSGKFARRVQDQYNEAISLGGTGTPFTLIMVGTDSVVLEGAQPYDSMRAAIDAVLEQLPASQTATSTQ